MSPSVLERFECVCGRTWAPGERVSKRHHWMGRRCDEVPESVRYVSLDAVVEALRAMHERTARGGFDDMWRNGILSSVAELQQEFGGDETDRGVRTAGGC